MNSFPALYGSLEQIHLGPPKSSVEGSTIARVKVGVELVPNYCWGWG